MGVAMSKLVDRAIDAAGLGTVLSSRRAMAPLDAHLARLRAADLLALGALADQVRAEEVGAEVRIHTGGDASAPPSGDAGTVVLPRGEGEVTGLDLLREVAVARITGPRGVHVRIDWDRCGLELAQVALGFGADELMGFIATKRGLPIADGELLGVGKKSRRELAQVVKRKELAACVERAGRVPLFVRADGAFESIEGAIEAGDGVEEAEHLQEAM
jgi:2-iminoacetate synthase ThiH